TEGIWNDLRVLPESITRNPELVTISSAQFFIDAKDKLELSDITLANFIEEMKQTLYCDQFLFDKNSSITSDELIHFSNLKIQSYINGHPKLILNKGRIGWNSADISEYAPEYEKDIQFSWLLV